MGDVQLAEGSHGLDALGLGLGKPPRPLGQLGLQVLLLLLPLGTIAAAALAFLRQLCEELFQSGEGLPGVPLRRRFFGRGRRAATFVFGQLLFETLHAADDGRGRVRSRPVSRRTDLHRRERGSCAV